MADSSAGGKSEDRDFISFVQCMEGLQIVCKEAVLPCVENVIREWHTKHQQVLQPCTSPRQCSTYPPHCENCTAWISAIKSAHWSTSGGQTLSWSNVNPSRLHQDPVEVAKAFSLRLPLPGRQRICTFSDFDGGSLLKIMMSFGDCHKQSIENYTIIKQVTYTRNMLMHMNLGPHMQIQLAERNAIFDRFFDLVDCIQRIQPEYLPAQNADHIRLALQMVTKKSQPEISLLQQMLISPEDLQTEVLQIAQDVQKTPKTIYHFPVVRSNLAYVAPELLVTFDIVEDEEGEGQHQIGLGDMADRIQQQLKQTYSERYKIRRMLPTQRNQALVDEVFLDLKVIREGNTIEYERAKTLPSYSQLFTLLDSESKPCEHILLSGSPGAGKTTLISKFAYQWSTQGVAISSEVPQELEWLSERFKFVFDVEFRKIKSGMDLLDAIKDQCLPNFAKQDIFKVISENSDKCLFLFDGYDDISSEAKDNQVMDSALLERNFVIVTTRPTKVANFCNLHPGYLCVLLSGISVNQVHSYINNYFGVYTDSAAALMNEIHSNESLQALTSIPVFLNVICWIWQHDEKALPQQITPLFQRVIEYMSELAEAKGSIDSYDIDVLLNGLGKVALDGLFENHFYLEKEKFDDGVLDWACKVGFLEPVRELHIGLSRHDTHVTFIHKVFQEYCAAVFWANLLTPDRERFILHLHKINKKNAESMKYLLQFCCGLNPRAAPIIIAHLLQLSGKFSGETLSSLLPVEFRTTQMSPQAKPKTFVSTKSENIGYQGGDVILSDVDVTLKIPKGALPQDETVQISITVDPRENHPTLKEGQLILGPVISCKPDGLKFLKPVTLSVPHSGVTLTTNWLQVWCSRETHTSKTWEKIYDGSQNDVQGEVQALVEGNKIKLRVNHFTLYDFLTAPVSTFKNWLSGLQLDIWAFLYPVNVETSENVQLRVYALKSNDAASKILVENIEKDDDESGMCSIPSTFVLKSNEENLTVVVKNIVPEGKWLPEDSMTGIIPYNNILIGGLGARCEVKFRQNDIPEQANKFEGAFDLKQKGNTSTVEGIHFYDRIGKKKRNKATDGNRQAHGPRKAQNELDASAEPCGEQTDRSALEQPVLQLQQKPLFVKGAVGSELSARSCRPKQRQQIPEKDQEQIVPLLSACTLEEGASSSSSINLGDWSPFLKTVARGVESEWQTLALALGFTPEECTGFEQATKHNLPSWWPAFKMLEAWRKKLPPCELTQLRNILADTIEPINSMLAKQIVHGKC